jgi:hypothetical protein
MTATPTVCPRCRTDHKQQKAASASHGEQQPNALTSSHPPVSPTSTESHLALSFSPLYSSLVWHGMNESSSSKEALYGNLPSMAGPSRSLSVTSALMTRLDIGPLKRLRYVTEPTNYTKLSKKIIRRADDLANLSPYNPVVREITMNFKPTYIPAKIVISLAVTITSYIKVRFANTSEFKHNYSKPSSNKSSGSI